MNLGLSLQMNTIDQQQNDWADATLQYLASKAMPIDSETEV